MASTKQMQQRAKAAKQAPKPLKVIVPLGITPFKVYKRNEIYPANKPLPIVITPEGLQAHASKIVNVAIIPAGKDQPVSCYMTGYGASYMARVMGDSDRADEYILNMIELGNPNGWMIQAFLTVVGELTDKMVDNFAAQISASIPVADHRYLKGGNLKCVVECGASPVAIGFVPQQ